MVIGQNVKPAKISTSKQLRQAFLARGDKLPQTVQNVRSIIISFSHTLKRDIKKMIEVKKGAGRFCCHS